MIFIKNEEWVKKNLNFVKGKSLFSTPIFRDIRHSHYYYEHSKTFIQ
jgi:hypothetical protein